MPEELLYEGKAKKVFTTDDEGLLLHRYKDDATAFNAQKRGSWKDKGKTNKRYDERSYLRVSRNQRRTDPLRRAG